MKQESAEWHCPNHVLCARECAYGYPPPAVRHAACYRVVFWQVVRGQENLVVRYVCADHLEMVRRNYHIKTVEENTIVETKEERG